MKIAAAWQWNNGRNDNNVANNGYVSTAFPVPPLLGQCQKDIIISVAGPPLAAVCQQCGNSLATLRPTEFSWTAKSAQAADTATRSPLVKLRAISG
ncbi:hypothetical protein ACLKA6_017403 [Drosophila palustris]